MVKQKNKNNKKTLSALALVMVGILGMSMVMAYQGDPNVKGPDYTEERHRAMEAAFFNEDYDAWVTLMTEDGRHPKVVDIVTEENFVTFVEVHEAMESGDMENARELRAELGLGQGKMSGNGGEGLKQGSGMQGLNKGQGNNGDCVYGN